MQGVDTIKNLNRQSAFEHLNQAVYKYFQDQIFSLGKLNIRISVVSGVITTAIMIFTIGIGSYYVLNEQLLLGELMATISLVSFVAPAIVNLTLISIPINEAKVAFNRMFEFVNIQPEKEDGEMLSHPVTSINIENLSFRFPGRKNILNHISLSVSANEIVFIIGENGCGKSTLCKILEKSYVPESGHILLNNLTDINDISLNEWRKRIGVIPQEIFIFNGTILDNICLGAVDKTVQEVLTVCSNLKIDKYVSRFPQGYATIVGEEGINLSGGEKQLIALARLLVKEPQIMILDEPTSSMDKELETFTLQLLRSIKKERIIFFVSHRLHILKKYADRIFLMENGKINYSDTHQNMLHNENIYSSYWNEFNNE
jgi:ATP-binding cassette subfamily B protein